MDRFRQMAIAGVFLAAAGAAWAQDKAVSAPGFDADACAKHCQGMAASHQKIRESHRAMEAKTASAWKEIRAAVDEAKKARGEKKIARIRTANGYSLTIAGSLAVVEHLMKNKLAGGAYTPSKLVGADLVTHLPESGPLQIV